MQNSRLCVSAVLLLAVLTGVYWVMIEPVTNVVTATRTTYSEITYVRTTGMTVGTVTTYFISTAVECQSGYQFWESIDLAKLDQYGNPYYQFTYYNVCISWYWLYHSALGPFADTRELETTERSVSTTYWLMSPTITSTTLSLPVSFPVTVTESVPNPQKSNLQTLLVVLSIAGVGGIAVAIILRRPPGSR